MRRCRDHRTRRQTGRRGGARALRQRPHRQGRVIQCRAALENTASNCCVKGSASPFSHLCAQAESLRRSDHAQRTHPRRVTRAPVAAIFAVSAPSPQPRSRMSWSACGFNRLQHGRAEVSDEAGVMRVGRGVPCLRCQRIILGVVFIWRSFLVRPRHPWLYAGCE